ncbi:MAG: NUDIX hydrolase [Caulobacterales bacterium]
MSERTKETPPRTRPMTPKDAATLLLIRRDGAEPRVLMGQRSKGHVFMPHKWVFPGGRVDRWDGAMPAAHELTEETAAKLQHGGVKRPPRALAMAAVRETFEETGLIIGKAGALHGSAPAAWKEYAAHHAAPDLSKFTFIFRAITPPIAPRRFDARFFLAYAEDVLLDDRPHLDSDELLSVKWFTFEEALALDLPDVTAIVIKEAQKRVAGGAHAVPFFRFRAGAPARTVI